ncbi:hypothetical protein Q2T40_20915 [Winogradskyella maritima]|nr:hypothetical protein [Winogradskyella maritima]
MEEGRLRLALERIAQQNIYWKNCEKPTPFSFLSSQTDCEKNYHQKNWQTVSNG